MSTQKNEHNPKPTPQLWMCDQEHGRDFCIYMDGKSTEQVYTEFRRLADQGRDVWLIHQGGVKELPDGRRITPPTDTTGSGREGETPETDALWVKLMAALKKAGLHPMDANEAFALLKPFRQLERQRNAALAKNADLLKSENDQLADIEALTSHITTDVDAPETSGSVVEKVERLLAQVEALRRDGERLQWLLDLIAEHGTDGLQSFPWSILDDPANDPDEDDPDRLTPILDRAAIDSAQRQEKP